jgi:hypothetical protein
MKYEVEKTSEKEKTIKRLKDCWHEIITSRGSDKVARCEHCDYGKFELKWYCPKSPDHICHWKSMFDYPSGLRYVFSINGEKIYLKDKSYKGNYESPDYCIFCGEPEERK